MLCFIDCIEKLKRRQGADLNRVREATLACEVQCSPPMQAVDDRQVHTVLLHAAPQKGRLVAVS